MNVLLVVDSYLPHTTSAAKLTHDLAGALARKGHGVTVLNSSRQVEEAVCVSTSDRVRVITVRSGKRQESNLVMRAIAELLLPFQVWLRSRRLLAAAKIQLIVFYSPTIFWGWLVKRIHRAHAAPSYLVLRDFFPEWAADLGLMRRSGPVFRFFRAVAKYQYRVADRIGVQSPNNLRQFRELYPQYGGKTEILWNWSAEPDHRNSSPARSELVPPDKVVFFYGGNLGIAQGVPRLISLAKHFRGEPGVHILAVGRGSEYEQLSRAVRANGLENISIAPAVPQEEYERVLQLVGVGIVLLDAALTTHNIPGKLVAYAMAGKPILADVNEGNDLIELVPRYKAGLVSVGSEAQFLSNASSIASSAELRREMGRGARQLALTHFSVDRCAEQILQLGTRT